MYLISGILNILLACIIFALGARDMQNAVYEIPAVLALVIGCAVIFKARKQKGS